MKNYLIKNFLLYWLPVLIWAGIIFTLSSIPSLKSGFAEDFILRKIAHALEFAIFAFLIFRAILAQSKPSANHFKVILLAFSLSLFYAFSDEFHQLCVLGRHGSIWDVGIDTIGILIASVLCYIIYRKGRIRD